MSTHKPSPGTKIGFFDSGLGGVTILNAVRQLLPQYDYIFYGDTKNLPYGNKDEAMVRKLTKQAISHLFDEGAALAIIACNTASAETLRHLQDTMLVGLYHDKRILGVIIPTIETLVAIAPSHALLIGTKRTIASKKYERELINRTTRVHLESIATPELVPLIEADELTAAFSVLRTVLDKKVGEIDVLVLGCTHYTVLKELIRDRYHGRFTVIAQDEVIPEKLKAYLENHPEIETKLTRGRSLTVELSQTNTIYDALIPTPLRARGET